MASQRKLVYWIALLGALHGVVVCAGFFATYDPEEQVRTRPYVPPMRIHFVDARGSIHLRPFVYDIRPREGAFDEYEEDTGRTLHFQFFVRGSPYRLLVILPGRLHLFGAGDACVYLLVVDGYGRDLLSRILVVGQIFLLAGVLAAGPACCVKCKGARLRPRGTWLRGVGGLPPAQTHSAADRERCSHSSRDPRASVRSRRGNFVVSGTRRARARPELGQFAGKPATIQRFGVLLVDVLARGGNGAFLPRVPGPCERVAGTRGRAQDRSLARREE